MNFAKKFLCLNTFIIILTVGFILVNGFYSFVFIMTRYTKGIPDWEPGQQYADFKDKLDGVKTIGFLTNRTVRPEKGSEEFLQAQYMLAPVVLDLGGKEHEFTLLDFTEDVFIFYTLKKIQANPFHDNAYNKVLARKVL